MKRIYLFSPLPPVSSGIAEYTKVLVNHLTGYELHVVIGQSEVSPIGNCTVHHWKEFLHQPLEKDAVCIYQIGNHEYHRYVFPFLFAYPGIVVLHDFILTDNRFHVLRQYHTGPEISDEVKYCIGSQQSGDTLSWFIADGLFTADSRFLYPELNRIIVEAGLCTIVHNPDTRDALQLMYPDRAVFYLPMGFWRTEAFRQSDPQTVHRKREALGYSQDDLVLGHFGVLSSYKRVDRLIELVSRLRERECPAQLLIVGFEGDDVDLKSLVTRYRISDYIRHIPNVSYSEYLDLIRCVDVGYSLRFPPVGEFSLSTAELMACARPVILLQHRFSAHLPDNVCIKIQPTREMDDLVESTLVLYRNPALARRIGEKAREYVQSTNSIDGMIDGYRDFIGATEYFQKKWKDPRPNFPYHLRPLKQRFDEQIKERFPAEIPSFIRKELDLLFKHLDQRFL